MVQSWTEDNDMNVARGDLCFSWSIKHLQLAAGGYDGTAAPFTAATEEWTGAVLATRTITTS
jgi:hypothetical protein